MKIFSELQKLSKHLEAWKGAWALCGGVAASLYRDTPRFTVDIDVAIVAQGDTSAEKIAQKVLAEMKYPSLIGFVPGFSPQEKQLRALVSTRHEATDKYVGIDFLLPVFPW